MDLLTPDERTILKRMLARDRQRHEIEQAIKADDKRRTQKLIDENPILQLHNAVLQREIAKIRHGFSLSIMMPE